MREFHISINGDKQGAETSYGLALVPVEQDGPGEIHAYRSEEELRNALVILGGEEGADAVLGKLKEPPHQIAGAASISEEVAELFGCPQGWPHGDPAIVGEVTAADLTDEEIEELKRRYS